MALTGELRGVYCEDVVENWPRYNGIGLYKVWDTDIGGITQDLQQICKIHAVLRYT